MTPEARAPTPLTGDLLPEEACPWCPYTAPRKRLLTHMESVHHSRWEALALQPPLAGGVVVREL